MTSSTRSQFVSVFAFGVSGVTAACMGIALASLLSANPKGHDTTGRVVALIACTSLSGTCLALAAGAATDD